MLRAADSAQEKLDGCEDLVLEVVLPAASQRLLLPQLMPAIGLEAGGFGHRACKPFAH